MTNTNGIALGRDAGSIATQQSAPVLSAIAQHIVTASVASVALPIPAIIAPYLCVRIYWLAHTDAGSPRGMTVNLNGDAGNTYTYQLQQASAATMLTSYSANSAPPTITVNLPYNGAPTLYAAGELVVYDPTNPAMLKQFLSTATGPSGGGATEIKVIGCTWNNVAPVTLVTFTCTGGNIAAGSKFTMSYL